MTIPVFSLKDFVRGYARRPGQPVVREDEWDYVQERMASGKVVTYSSWTWPIHHWTIDFNFLYDNPDNIFNLNSDTDLRMLRGLFNQMGAGLSPFYFEDPVDRTTENETLGVSDGTKAAFQLIRTIGGFVEPMQSPAALVAGHPKPRIWHNGALVAPSAYAVSGNGFAVFTPILSGGFPITAAFDYFFLAQFEDKKLGFEEFLHQIHQTKQLKIQSIKQ